MSLQQKKYRIKLGLFVAEGVKVVNELLNSPIELDKLYYTSHYSIECRDEKTIQINDIELKKISKLKTPNKVLGIFKIPKVQPIDEQGLIVALDGISDPGNLGTIIRLCDWFGVKQLVCSNETVDCYNSKVVQATMGSLSRVNIVYCNLYEFLEKSELPIYGAVMNGNNIYQSSLLSKAILVMGNEANGLSDKAVQLITKKITIPRFGELKQTESLNVATATAILLSEFRRK